MVSPGVLQRLILTFYGQLPQTEITVSKSLVFTVPSLLISPKQSEAQLVFSQRDKSPPYDPFATKHSSKVLSRHDPETQHAPNHGLQMAVLQLVSF